MHFLKSVALLMPIIIIATSDRIIFPLKVKDLKRLLLHRNSNLIKTEHDENANDKAPEFRASSIIVLSLGGNTDANSKTTKPDVDVKKAIAKRKYFNLLKKRLELLLQNTKNVIRNRTRDSMKNILRSDQAFETSVESSSHEFTSYEKRMFQRWRQNFSCAGSTVKPAKFISDDTLRPIRYNKVNDVMNEVLKHKFWRPGYPPVRNIYPPIVYQGIIRPLTRLNQAKERESYAPARRVIWDK